MFKFTLHRPVNNSVSNIQSFVFLFEVQRVAVIKFEADMNKKFKSLCCKRKYFSKSGFYENKN